MVRPANFDYNFGSVQAGATAIVASQAVGRLSWTAPVRAATTVAGTLATSFENGDSVDGVVLATGDRVLVKDQAAGAENGIYVVNASGAPTPTRAADYDSEGDILGSVVVVTNGTTNADTLWQCTTNATITVGTTALSFAAVGGAPTTADYLVGSAQAGLSAEIVVGSTPGGELGGTWASPTVDATHSGSTHAATQAAAEATAAAALAAHTAAHTGGLLASIAAASAAIANTETVVVSATLAANSMVAGASFRIRAAGVGTTGLTPGVDTFRIRIGTTTLTGTIPCSVAPPANISVTAQPFSFEALVTVRTAGAGGTIIGECLAVGDDAATGLFTLLVDLSAITATVAVDTTAAKLLELTFQSGAASSSATFHVATIEGLGAAGATGGLSGAILSPSSDTHIDSQNGTANYDTATTLTIGNKWGTASFTRFGLLTFDTSTLAGKTIQRAFLRLTRTDTVALLGGALLQARRLLRAYVFNQATWNVYSTANNWTTAGASGEGTDVAAQAHGATLLASAPGVATNIFELEITRLVQEDIDASSTTLRLILGMANADASINAISIASINNATAAYRPTLHVIYT